MVGLREEISNSFKLSGFTLRIEGRNYLESLLLPVMEDSPQEVSEWISKILEYIQDKSSLETPIINKQILIQAVEDCSKEVGGSNEIENLINVIDAFQIPKYIYSQEKNKFLLHKNPSNNIFSEANVKAELFRSRYSLLLQKTSRHELFTPSIVGSSNEKKFHLKKIEYLLGTTNKLSDVIVLGMITRLSAEKLSLEDPTGIVTLDISAAKFQSGLYTEGCFVLVEGWYEDFTFHAIAMGFTPIENANTTRKFLGNVNFFGGFLENCAKSYPRLAEIESENLNSMFVFLSDVSLDQSAVFGKLGQLFAGYSAMPPTCFVLMGNFLSSPQGVKDFKILRDHFKALGELVSEFPEIKEKSKFILIPGPSDPGYPNILPRPGLPKYIAEEFTKRVPNVELASNPCRIQYCTQEILIFREDIVTKMCRNCIYFPESGQIPGHFAKTIISQSHLCPLPLHICPVYWEHDRALGLYPIPDLIVIGDKFDPFVTSQSNCQILNPGSFVKNEYSFKTYIPKTKQIEESQIPDH